VCVTYRVVTKNSHDEHPNARPHAEKYFAGGDYFLILFFNILLLIKTTNCKSQITDSEVQVIARLQQPFYKVVSTAMVISVY